MNIPKKIFLAIVCLSTFYAPAFAQNSKVENRQPVPAFRADERLKGNTVSFFIMGDWGTGTKMQKKIAQGMITKFGQDKVDAVLTVGDNFLPDGVESVKDYMWGTRFETMYPKDKLPVPFYAVLGNHDYGLNPDAQVEYTGTKLADGSITRWNMPSHYWTKQFTRNGVSVRLIGLDTYVLFQKDIKARKRQFAWLDSVLAASAGEWRIVIGHHPVYSNGYHGNTIGMMTQVKPIFEKHAVHAYFCGHDHDLQLLSPENGVNYIVTGGGGSSRDTRYGKNTIFGETNGGFVYLQINATEMLLQFVDDEGKVMFAKKLVQ